MGERDFGVNSLRYRHLGPDPIAKQLYAVVFAAEKTYIAARAALEQYLDSPQARTIASTTEQTPAVTR